MNFKTKILILFIQAASRPSVGVAPSTTATSDDDVTHYHAYTQTSDSDQRSTKFRLTGLTRKKNGRGNGHRKAGRSFDPSAKDILEGGTGFRPPYQSSSDLSSPNNETCYSFVRRALQVSECAKRTS